MALYGHHTNNTAFKSQESGNNSAVTSTSVSHQDAMEMSSQALRSHLKVQLGKEPHPHRVLWGQSVPCELVGEGHTSLHLERLASLNVATAAMEESEENGSHGFYNLTTEEMSHYHHHTIVTHTQGGRTTHGHEPRHKLPTMPMFNF